MLILDQASLLTESHVYDVNIIYKPAEELMGQNSIDTLETVVVPSTNMNKEDQELTTNMSFKICPDCNNKSLKNENGCDSCMSCGYSKCDKYNLVFNKFICILY